VTAAIIGLLNGILLPAIQKVCEANKSILVCKAIPTRFIPNLRHGNLGTEDPVKLKLDAAKERYTATTAKHRKTIYSHFESMKDMAKLLPSGVNKKLNARSRRILQLEEMGIVQGDLSAEVRRVLE